jgi:hypothetical protein
MSHKVRHVVESHEQRELDPETTIAVLKPGHLQT